MANPKVHFRYSIAFAIGYALASLISTGIRESYGVIENPINLLWIILFGIFVDLDHVLHWEKTKGMTKSMWKDKKLNDPVGRYTRAQGKWGANLFHTWPFLVVVLFCCFLLKTSFPLAGYGLHIFIDCGDRGYIRKANRWEIPGILGKFTPEGWRYGRFHDEN